MAVQFILGRSGTGKTTLCTRSIADSLVSEGGGAPLVLLVPEQATWQAERAILADHRIAGYSRLRVLSFNRLMFHLPGGGAGFAQHEISRLGQQMAVHKILRENAERLRAFGGSAKTQGLAAELTKTIVELHEYEQQPDDVDRLAEGIRRTCPEDPSADKFADLALVYRRYLEFLESRADVFVNPDARLTAVRQQVRAAAWLNGMRLWVDGFSSFTVQQRELLIELLKVAEESVIALCLDPADFDWRNPGAGAIDPADLFNSTRRTYADLLEAAVRTRLELREPVILSEARRFASSPALAHVEKNLFSAAPPPRGAAGDAVRIAAAPSTRAEVVWIAREIHRVIRREGCRFRDIAVVFSDLGSYQHYVDAVFSEYGIPFFIDRPRSLADHPVVELLTSALQAALGGFACADVFAFLKTGLTDVAADEIDRLENYCLAHGADGEDWVAAEPWSFAAGHDKRFDGADVDGIRRRAVEPLVRLRRALSPPQPGGGITAETFTRAVWECLQTLQVPEKIAGWCGDDPDDRHGHRQFYEKLVALFDDFNAVFGDDCMPAADFAAILTQAAAGLSLKLIPSSLDQVLVGAIERSRHPDLGVVFVAGATQKAFPSPVTFDPILSDDDRRVAEAHDFEMADRLSRQLACRQYLAYIAFTRPSRRLYITYPTMDADGRPVVRSSFVDQLAGLFADLRPISCVEDASTSADIYTAHELKSLLCESLGRDGRDCEHRDRLVQLYRAMSGHDDPMAVEAARSTGAALDYDNEAKLDGALCGRLMGPTMDSSVTRLGAFAECPFSHFARHVLKVDRRKLFRVEPVDLGAFYHRVLDGLYRTLDKAGKDITGLDKDELLRLCRGQIANVLQTDAFLANFRKRGAHNAYILDSAARAVEECVAAVAEMSRAGCFRQRASELKFGGGDQDMPVCRLDLAGGRSVNLHGSIDRVDIAERNGKNIALVFDYKRRSQSVSWSRLYHGLDMQLAVYMLALQNARVAGRRIDAVAGAFFVPIEVLPASETISGMDSQTDKFRYRARGIFDGCFAELLDGAAGRGHNRFYSFATDKDGLPYNYFGTGGALRPEQFEAVLAATRKRIIEFAENIMAGRIDIRPYRMARISPCGNCDYGALCRFDWQINDYNPLESLGKNAVLEKWGVLSD